jgi:N-acylglucosamine-6-phosphate 2-epimerase
MNIEVLKGKLIVSCQPVTHGPMDQLEMIVAMARAAVAGGASGLRIEGVENVRAVSAVVDVPIIGIAKRDLAETPVRITPFEEDVRALAEAVAQSAIAMQPA